MGLAIVHSRARAGVHAPEVRVEVHLGGGLPSMSIVGLPEAAVREAKDRVRAAIHCAQFEFPARRITINLAPADLPKHGGRFDLAIALGILAASGQVSGEALDGWEFLGELALTGEIRAVDGVLAAALASGRAGRRLLVPPANGSEAALAARLASLSPQQFRVLVLVAEGLLNKQIADRLDVQERTVKAHLTAIFERLGVRNRTQAGVVLRELELSDPARQIEG